MRIALIGAGAVGLGISSGVLKAGLGIDLVCRPKAVGALRSDGLFRSGVLGNYFASPLQFRTSLSADGLPHTVCDFILVCTKGFNAAGVAAQLAGCPWLVDSRTILVLFLNGWGSADEFLPCFPPQTIISARLMTGFRKPAENHLDITVHGDGDISKDLWEKLPYNGAVNGVGAICGAAIGELAADPNTEALMEMIVKEAFAVMERAGYSTHLKSVDEYLEFFPHETAAAHGRS